MAELLLTDDEKNRLLQNAREAIAARLEQRAPLYDPPTDALEQPMGAFVTLHVNGRLRGCIGRMTGVSPLFETVQNMAVSSAFSDPRFPPLTLDEFSETEIEISILSPLREISDVSAIEVGTHGIYMTSGSRTGVLLPQVAVEQRWTRGEFLENTCRKAGLPAGAWKNPTTSIQIFEALIISE